MEQSDQETAEYVYGQRANGEGQSRAQAVKEAGDDESAY